MLRLLIASTLLSLSAQAAHLDTVCKSAIDNPPKFTTGFVGRINHEGRSVVETHAGKEIYDVRETVLGLASQEDKLWVLTYSQILELTKDGSVIKSHPIALNKSMTLAGDLLIILRQDGLLTALHTKTGEMMWNSYLDEVTGGLPVSVSFDGKNIQVIFATAYQGGFTGVATAELTKGKVLKKIPYESRKYGVIAPDAIAGWNQGNLIINNGGWIHVIESKQLSGKTIKPRWVSHRIPNEVNPHYMMLRGDFFFEGSTLVGCGSYRELVNEHDWNIVSALFRVQM